MDIKVGENIKRLREERALTQEALADALGVSAITVYMWEAGRLPVEYKMTVKIADLFEISADELLNNETEAKPVSSANDQFPINCRMCGGELIHNYLEGTCVCANCGNKRSIAELYPNYAKYSNVIATITKANEILNSKTELASADEANLLFKQAIVECTRLNDAVYSDLVKICYEGQVKADMLEAYCRGKHFYENKSFASALNELEKVRGYRDADVMIERCKTELGASRKRRLPWIIVLAVLSFVFLVAAVIFVIWISSFLIK